MLEETAQQRRDRVAAQFREHYCTVKSSLSTASHKGASNVETIQRQRQRINDKIAFRKWREREEWA